MADVLADPTLYVVLIILVLLGVVTYFELKFIRKKRRQRDTAQVQVDDTYNQIITSQAVSRALKQQGRDTKEADLALLEADSAFSRRNFVEAKAAVDKAKELLRTVKDAPPGGTELKSVSVVDAAPQQTPEERQKACEVPFQEAKKMPKNFMESKFMICSVRDEVEAAVKAGRDVSAAKDSLRLADEAFAAEQYTEALKCALRARKVLEPREDAPPQPAKVKGAGTVERVPSSVLVKPLASKCAKCQTELDSGDMFCAKCGAKVERDIRCPRCSNSVQVDDAYCRKCGLPLRSD